MTTVDPDLLSSVKKTIQEYYAKHDHVIFVYLFGSIVRRRLTDQSDIDVGVFYKPECLPGLEQRLTEQAELSDLLQREVDLAPLNQVTPIIRYQVLKYGECIVGCKARAAQEFFVRTINEYFDLKQNRQVIEKSLQNLRIL